MATLTTTSTALKLNLTWWEKVWGLHGDLEIPLSSIRSVAVDDDPIGAVRGLRAPGLGLPAVRIGTWRRRGERTFAVVRRHRPAVRLELDREAPDGRSGDAAASRSAAPEARFDRLVVSTPDAAGVAREIEAATAGALAQP